MKRRVKIDANVGHVLITGMTGSGKSVLATALINESRLPVLVGDPKGDFVWPNVPIVEKAADLLDSETQKAPRIIFRPTLQRNEDASEWGKFFEYAYRRKHTRIYMDEVYHVTDLGGDALTWYKRILTRGRSSNVFLSVSSQRPMRIPMESITEASHIFVFRLNYIEDRRRLAQNAGRDEFMQTPQDAFAEYFQSRGYSADRIRREKDTDAIRFGFWYLKVGEEKPQLFTAVKPAANTVSAEPVKEYAYA